MSQDQPSEFDSDTEAGRVARSASDMLEFRLQNLYEMAREPEDDSVSGMDTFLLTMMGIMGGTMGFWAVADPRTGGGRAVSRELTLREQDHLHARLADMIHRLFPDQSIGHMEAGLIPDDRINPDVFPNGTKVLIRWRVDESIAGFLGLGEKAASGAYSDEDTAFLLHMVRMKMISIARFRAGEIVRSLRGKILSGKRVLAKADTRADQAREELDRRFKRT